VFELLEVKKIITEKPVQII